MPAGLHPVLRGAVLPLGRGDTRHATVALSQKIISGGACNPRQAVLLSGHSAGQSGTREMAGGQMSKKKEIPNVHPLDALTVLSELNSRVSILLQVAEMAADSIERGDAAMSKAVVPELRTKIDAVKSLYSKHHEP